MAGKPRCSIAALCRTGIGVIRPVEALSSTGGSITFRLSCQRKFGFFLAARGGVGAAPTPPQSSPKGRGMSSFELNKIVASVLLALIVAWVAGLLSSKLIETRMPEKNAAQVANAPAAQQAAPPAGGEQAGPEPLGPLLASASVDAGKDVAKKCAACHTFEKGQPNRVGPNLYGVVDAPVGADRGGFPFSDALKKK